jgi:uncharacterized protein YjiK
MEVKSLLNLTKKPMQSVTDPPHRSQQIPTNEYRNSSTIRTNNNILKRWRSILHAQPVTFLIAELPQLTWKTMRKTRLTIQNHRKDSKILISNPFQA